ncbi:carbohydrate kinase [Flavobacterium sp. WLB]|uniref:Gluconokinase n=1 Tax=Flavobacterium panici TaxID=2654843 RepID=A0A9N8IZ43_9FLAO|nr:MULTISPECIES: gluconokinase [Flavobacterium]PUU68736.1 carbohydrate kinase [Flavobacterium sp. WLB]CAC9973190.1 gluconokinase [Flavobacterium panici]
MDQINNMEALYIGIDIGTTATKAVCFDKRGNVLRQIAKSYSMYHPKPEWSVQKPHEILQTVKECIDEITNGIQPQFISFSSAMQSVIAIDENGKPLTDAILWADNRAAGIAEKLKNSDQGKHFYQKTGIPIHPFSPLTKIAWFKEFDAELFSKTYKFISIKEYVWHHLTNEYYTDTSMASGTGLLNIHTLDWDEEVLDFLNIKPDQLSKVCEVTHQCKGISDDFLYIMGGGDGALANLGTGAMNKNCIALTIGTSGAVRLPIDKPYLDGQMRTQCYHLMDNQYLTLGAVNNGAIVLQWLKETLLNTTQSLEVLIEEAAKIPAGSDGLLFVPYLLGERAPIWDASAQGTLLGMQITHTQAHLVRATLEGILFGLFQITEILIPDPEHRKETKVMASGGFGKSELWLQMVADIFQMQVETSQTIEGSSWGAVLIGLKSLGEEITNDNKTGQTYFPNTKHKNVYEAAFNKFKKVYPLLKDF